jgi:probable rRNA maturation factor
MVGIYFHNQHPRHKVSATFLKKMRALLPAILAREKCRPAEVTVVMVDNPAIKKLNRKYHRRASCTDVLAFGFYYHGPTKTHYGDIYVSLDQTRAQAAFYKVPIENELARLMVHGTLHLCGHDDGTEKERRAMERLVENWLKS